MSVQHTWFPIIGTAFAIRWELLDESAAQRNHGQSLFTLASRGGLAPCEAIDMIKCQRWGTTDPKATLADLHKALEVTK